MKEIGKYATGIILGISLLVGFYFIEYKPSLKEAEEKGYRTGLEECQQDTDTTYLPSKPVIEYRDTSFSVINSAIISDSLITSSFDSTFISGNDTVSTKAIVSINTSSSKAVWDFSIEHKDFIQLPDTIKIITPRYIEKVVIENNWLFNMISFIAGIATTIITLLIAT